MADEDSAVAAEDTAAEEIDVVAAATAVAAEDTAAEEIEAEATDAVAAVTGQDTKLQTRKV